MQNRGSPAVFRTISSKVLTMERLGMGEILRKISDVPRGLVVLTGPIFRKLCWRSRAAVELPHMKLL